MALHPWRRLVGIICINLCFEAIVIQGLSRNASGALDGEHILAYNGVRSSVFCMRQNKEGK